MEDHLNLPLTNTSPKPYIVDKCPVFLQTIRFLGRSHPVNLVPRVHERFSQERSKGSRVSGEEILTWVDVTWRGSSIGLGNPKRALNYVPRLCAYGRFEKSEKCVYLLNWRLLDDQKLMKTIKQKLKWSKNVIIWYVTDYKQNGKIVIKTHGNRNFEKHVCRVAVAMETSNCLDQEMSCQIVSR